MIQTDNPVTNNKVSVTFIAMTLSNICSTIKSPYLSNIPRSECVKVVKEGQRHLKPVTLREQGAATECRLRGIVYWCTHTPRRSHTKFVEDVCLYVVRP